MRRRRLLSLLLLLAVAAACVTGYLAAYVVQAPWLPHQLSGDAVLVLALLHLFSHRRTFRGRYRR